MRTNIEFNSIVD